MRDMGIFVASFVDSSVQLVAFFIASALFLFASLSFVRRAGQKNEEWQRILSLLTKSRVPPHKRALSRRNLPSEADVIVIGSGLGGLTTAILLAKKGKRVLVLEQHYVAGGCTHVWTASAPSEDEPGSPHLQFEFDSGIHYLGSELGDRSWFSPVRWLFRKLSAGSVSFDYCESEHTDVMRLHSDAADAAPRAALLSRGREATQEQYRCRFPRYAKAIDRFFRESKLAPTSLVLALVLNMLNAPQWLRACFSRVRRRFLEASVAAKLDELGIDDAMCRAALTLNSGDHGELPDSACFAVQSAIFEHYVRGDATMPKDGSDSIARTLCRHLFQVGGIALVRARVDRILVGIRKDELCATGVRLEDGRVVTAPQVVSAAGVHATWKHLVDLNTCERVAVHGNAHVKQQVADLHALKTSHLSLGTSPAHTICFVGLEGSSQSLGLPAHNIWSWKTDLDLASAVARMQSCGDDLDAAYGTTNNDDDYSAENSKAKKHNKAKKHKEHNRKENKKEHNRKEDNEDKEEDETEDEVFDMTFVNFPSAKQTHQRGARSATATVIARGCRFSQWAEWHDSSTGQRGYNYALLKERITRVMLAHLFRVAPHLRDRVRYTALATPLTTRCYIAAPHGESYGLAATTRRFGALFDGTLSPRTPVRNLFLSGQDVFMPGVCGALLGGLCCAVSMHGFSVLW
ncbi:MAG: hypothetical protein MHM6MM_002949 [Cercozoa sp. M6MM]